MSNKLKKLMNKITKAGLLHFVRNDNTRKKVAFTLAEVLITLAIIGVVAALTLPTLNKKINEIVTVNKVTKIHATLSNALRMAINEHSNVDSWGLETLNMHNGDIVFMDNFKKYLKISQDCGFSQGCIAKTTYIITNSNVEFYYDGYDTSEKYYKLILADGSNLWMRTNGTNSCKSDSYCAVFWYDYNGKKEPNVIGKDIFLFDIKPDKVTPAGLDNSSNYDSCLEDGWYCAGYLLKNKNMNYLKAL